MFKNYYRLTKPGIIMGNLITAAGGFILASKRPIHFGILFMTLIGLGLIIGSACIINNYIDRHADAKMARTKDRALAKGLISEKKALLFSLLLGLLGTLVLMIYTNSLTVVVALLGFFLYVFVYSFWKYRSVHATLLGSLAGAVPPLTGYLAVSGHFDLASILLFLIVALWQMPHFFAIALFRLKEYANASIPVLPMKKGVHVTKVQILLYLIAFILASTTLTLFHYTGYAYLATMTLLGLVWLFLSLKGFRAQNDHKWAHRMFRFSLIVITALCVAIAFDVRY